MKYGWLKKDLRNLVSVSRSIRAHSSVRGDDVFRTVIRRDSLNLHESTFLLHIYSVAFWSWQRLAHPSTPLISNADECKRGGEKTLSFPSAASADCAHSVPLSAATPTFHCIAQPASERTSKREEERRRESKEDPPQQEEVKL